MKRYSLWVKCLMFFLAVVTLLGVAVSGLGILAAESQCMYTHDNYEDWIHSQYQDRAHMIADQVLMDYGASLSDCPPWILEQTNYANAIQYVKNWYDLSESNWRYTLQKDGKILRNTYNDSFEKDALHFAFVLDFSYPMVGVSEEYTQYFHETVTDEPVPVHYQYDSGYQVDIYISRNHTSYYINNGISQTAMKWLFAARYALVAVAAVSFLLFALAFVILMILAGKNPKTGDVNPRALNRVPLDLYLGAAVGITVLGCWLAYEMLDMLFSNDGYNVLMAVLLCGCGIIVATVDVGFFTAVAAQFKVPGGFWWRHSLCGRVLKLAWKIVKKVWGYIAKFFRRVGGYIRDAFSMLPVIWQWIAAGGALGFVLVIICATTNAHWYSVVPLAVWCIVFAALVIYCGYSYGVIQKGIRRMKDGDLYEKIDTQWLFGSFKTIAEDLNALADVVAIAAEKQLKSERMKTELITNVSHDIKTPLTSVINYVDLLQQSHTEEEGKQYLEVLSRQSARLKKLVEDLMDMSKASTGNMAVNVTTVDAVEAVNQALGEFADKLDYAQLTPVFRKPEGQLQMQADGRLTWRVLSNLLGNVVKYALPGTRVYVDLTTEGRWVVCSIKNISREELNISAEELTERFVRGDEARNTEGSGLGLNIAQSLMHLQHGTMELTVDGDLFKVTLAFPAE
ncbi:MAG: hypothetical protein IIW56_04910 [Oscillospiraceae bacterium]|nr:hypothetical protein [Oscillospiraceae bacterium]